MSDSPRAEQISLAPGPLRAVAAAALAVSAAALVAMAAVEAWQVFARYVLNSPAAWTEPLALLLLKIALMLAAAVAVRSETHFRFALGAEALGARARAAFEALARLATAAIGLVFAVSSVRLMIATWSMKTPGVSLSEGLYYAPFVGGGVLFVLFALEQLTRGAAEPER